MKKMSLLVLLVVVFGSCTKADAQTQHSIIGKWVREDTGAVFEFTKTSFISDGTVLEYKIENGAFIVYYQGAGTIFADSFEFVDNENIKFIGGPLEGTILKRVK
jgi:hypothetical protein